MSQIKINERVNSMCVHFFMRMIMNYVRCENRKKQNFHDKKIQWEIMNTQILNCLKFFDGDSLYYENDEKESLLIWQKSV